MKPRREALLMLGLLALLLLVTILGAIQRGRQEARLPMLSSHSNDPDGGSALYLWLDALGYPVSNQALDRYEIQPSQKSLLLLNPIYEVQDGDWEKLESWVKSGGTLLIIGNNWETLLLVERTGIEWNYRLNNRAILGAAHAGLKAPAPHMAADSSAACVLGLQPDNTEIEQSNVDILLTSKDGPAAITFSRGQGRVIIGCIPDLLSNKGLKDPAAAELALNLLALLPRGGSIWIDEWHHGERASATQPHLNNWLRQTPGGRAVLYSTLILLVALVLGGLALGKPLLPARRLSRRGPLEHVTALANLNRRAGHSRAVLEYHRQAIKRRYGRRYRVDPALPDEEFITALERAGANLSVNSAGRSTQAPSVSLPALAELLRKLDNPRPNEAEMVRLTAEAVAWIENHNERGNHVEI